VCDELIGGHFAYSSRTIVNAINSLNPSSIGSRVGISDASSDGKGFGASVKQGLSRLPEDHRPTVVTRGRGRVSMASAILRVGVELGDPS